MKFATVNYHYLSMTGFPDPLSIFVLFECSRICSVGKNTRKIWDWGTNRELKEQVTLEMFHCGAPGWLNG